MKAFAVLALVALWSAVGSAHPGDLDADGGHTCRTNCERYGLEYGGYHLHRLPDFHPPSGIPNAPETRNPPGGDGDADELSAFLPGERSNLWPGVRYLLGLWLALRVYQRLDGKPLTVRRFFRKILGSIFRGGV